MAIHYILRENKATADPSDYKAVVIPSGSVDQDAFLDRLVQAGSTLGRADMVAFMQLFGDVMGYILLEGQGVNLRFASFGVSIRGKFDGANDAFETGRHEFFVTVEAGPVLTNKVRADGIPQKDIAPLPEPVLVQFKDVNTGALNTTAKSAGLGEIKGDDLKFNTAAADEGIFFVPGTGSAVKVSVISTNFPKTLTFQNPTLTTQAYTVEVRKRFTPTGPLRTGTLPVQITGVL